MKDSMNVSTARAEVRLVGAMELRGGVASRFGTSIEEIRQ